MSPIDIDVLANHDRKYFYYFLFDVLLLTVPHAQPFVKVGARAPVPQGVGAYAFTTQ